MWILRYALYTDIVPVAILNMKDRWGVIKNQVVVAGIMLVVQICYMIIFK